MTLNQAIAKASYYAVKLGRDYVVKEANGTRWIEPDGSKNHQIIGAKTVYIAENCYESAVIAGLAK